MWEWFKRLFGKKKPQNFNSERREATVVVEEVVKPSEIEKPKVETQKTETPVAKKPAPKVEKPVAKKPTPKQESKVVSKKTLPKVKKVAENPKKLKTEINVLTTIETVTTEQVLVNKKHYEQTSKADLLDKLHSKFPEETKVSIKEIVDHVFEVITETLEKKEEVAINNFGKLETQHKNARDGINPLTGEDIKILATNSVKFKASKHLKEEMSKQKWTGLYQVEKTIEKTTIDEYDFEEEVSSKTEASDFLDRIEEKYKESLDLDIIDDETIDNSNLKSISSSGLSAEERAKLDGSDSIDEARYELQKHANALRTHAIKNQYRKSLQEVNLRDMTKKELVVYMKKVQKVFNESK